MPTVISMDEFAPPKEHARKTYPDEWFDGQARQFTKDEDFPTMQAASFVGMLHHEAKRRGLKIRTRTVDESTVNVCAVVAAQ